MKVLFSKITFLAVWVLCLWLTCSCVFASSDKASDEAMSKHYHKHKNDLQELVQYAESLSDSVSLSFPSDSIPSQISKEQYLDVLSLLRKTQCKSIITYSHSVWGNNTMVVFYRWVFTSHGYIFLPDNTVKLFRWDPLGSDYNGLYDIEEEQESKRSD